MATANYTTTRPRIIGSIANRYLGKNVSIVGEVISITPHANTVTLRMPDDENIVVLLQKNSSTIEPNLLTEVAGKLVSRGQIEATQIKQWSHKESALFNKNNYAEAVNIFEAYRLRYDL